MTSTMLPALRSGGSGAQQPPADAALFKHDKQVPDERLGHSGSYPRGAIRASDSPTPQLASHTSLGALDTADKPGPGLSKLTPAMDALDSTLREALHELASRNMSALQAIRETADAVITQAQAAHTRTGITPGGTTTITGSLSLAAASPSTLPTSSGAGLVGAPASLATSPARLNAAMTAGALSKSAGGALDTAAATSRVGGATLDTTARVVLGPRWGTTEGGRDNLGWVRNLVRYSEASPLYVADDRSPEVAVDASGTGFKKAVFPSLRPDRREDATLLAHWLQDMVGQLSSKQALALAAQIKATPSPGRSSGSPPGSEGGDTGATAGGAGDVPTSVLDLADGVLHVYQVAFDELKRQVGSECKERSALLSMLWEHWSSAVELRTSLASEARLGAMQAEYTRLMAARDSLSADVSNLNITIAEKDRDARFAEVATAHSTRSLAGKLAAAQAQAEELNCHYKVADMSLSNEVERRMAAEKQLEVIKQLLSKSEHEWLGFRAQTSQLEKDNAALRKQLQSAHDELDAAAVAADTAHHEFAALMETHMMQDVDMSRMRREFETDEILIVSFKQQVRDLEAQLAQLKVFQRDQALKLGAVAADKEALEVDKAKLQSELAASQSQGSQLEASLAATEQDLALNKAALSEKSEAYARLEAQMQAELAEAAQKLLEVTTELRQTSDTLSDTDHKLAHSENKRRELDSELHSVKEMLNGVCRSLDAQGADGVPKANDKGWAVMGPLGATQRAVMVAGRQVAGLWERLEACKQEVSVVTQRLEAELNLMARLQDELHASRAMEAKVMAEKEVVEAQLDIAHQAKRVLEAEALTDKGTITQLKARVNVLEDEQGKDRDELEELRPLRGKNKELGNQVEDLSESLRMTSAALVSAKEDLAQITEMQEFYKNESERLITDNAALITRIQELVVFESEVVQVRAEVVALQEDLEDVRQRLDAALAAHADTLHQLEIARFFLQGLDLVPPQSPMSSTMSQPVHPGARPGSAAPGGIAHGEVGWRPTTAPGAVGRPPARSMSERYPSGRGDADYLNVSHLSLVEEEGGPSSDGHRSRGEAATRWAPGGAASPPPGHPHWATSMP